MVPNDRVPEGIDVCVADEDDAPTAGALHATQIGDGFLSFLGPRFLGRLYRRISRSPTSFLLVARADRLTVGFIAGSTDVSGLYRSFAWRDGPFVAATAAGKLLSSWRRVLETARHGSSGGTARGRGAELLAVAVDPSRQGQGVGALLVGSFLDEVSRRGQDAAYVVVGSANAPAIALYERCGFHSAARTEVHPGTVSLVMQWDRPEPGDAAAPRSGQGPGPAR